MSGEVFTGGATTSQHVDAEDDDHFENTTFKLKRTRSLGLLDEFIPDKAKEQALEDGKISQNQKQHLLELQLQLQLQLQPNNLDGQQLNYPTAGQPSSAHHPESDDSSNSSYFNPSSAATSNTASAATSASAYSNQSTSVSSSPSPVPSPTSAAALHLQSPELIPYDDTDLAAEPSQHVDYLSHQWNVSDISKSWRYVISKKKDVANAARLENASWRTWAQRRSNLKTISPEVVNWSKDSDVTWLYGPIFINNNGSSGNGQNNGNDENDDNHSYDEDSTATNAVAGDISIAKKPKNKKNAPKPILKKRTVEESIISHSNLLKLQLATSLYQKKKEQKAKQQQQQLKQQLQLQLQQQMQLQQLYQGQAGDNGNEDEYFDFGALLNKLNAQYNNKTPTDNSNVAKLQNLLNSSNSSSLSTIKQDDNTAQEEKLGAGEFGSGTNLQQQQSREGTNYPQGETGHDASGVTGVTPIPNKKDRHIHFNEEVQQCIACDYYLDDYDDDEYDDGNGGSGYRGYSSDEEDDTEVYDDYADQVNDNLIRSQLYADDDDDDVIDGDGDQGDSEDNDNGDDDDDDDDDDDAGGFFLQVKSNSSAPLKLGGNGNSNSNVQSKRLSSNRRRSSDGDSLSTTSSSLRNLELIRRLPSTTINYGSDEDSSDEEFPYTSSVSHNVNNDSSRGYDYYYDYNTVYTCDPSHPSLKSYQNTDVVDVPKDLEIESNMNYELIDDKDVTSQHPHVAGGASPSIGPAHLGQSPKLHSQISPQLSTTSNESTGNHAVKHSPFQLSDSDSDSDDEEADCLSIGTRRSSQGIIDLVIDSNGLSELRKENTNRNQEGKDEQSPFNGYHHQDPVPINEHVSSINSRHSSSALSKQSRSTNSLSQQFFGGQSGLSDQDRALSKLFLGDLAASSPSSSTSSSTLAQHQPDRLEKPVLTRTLSNTNPKSSLSRAKATSENAFGVSPNSSQSSSPIGYSPGSASASSSASASNSNSGMAPVSQTKRGQFLFDGDSESESNSDDDEGMVIGGGGGNRSGGGNRGQSYSTLSHLADKSGIRNQTQNQNQNQNQNHSATLPTPYSISNDQEGEDGKDKDASTNLIGQAKGLAKHFFGQN